MASRWISLRSGKGKLRARWKASWENVLSPLIARKVTPRLSSSRTT